VPASTRPIVAIGRAADRLAGLSARLSRQGPRPVGGAVGDDHIDHAEQPGPGDQAQAVGEPDRRQPGAVDRYRQPLRIEGGEADEDKEGQRQQHGEPHAQPGRPRARHLARPVIPHPVIPHPARRHPARRHPAMRPRRLREAGGRPTIRRHHHQHLLASVFAWPCAEA
jgi:hypothetical protein